MKMDTLWDESINHRLKVERNLNFSTISNEEDEFGFSRKKTARDPMSHRIIEKRRRDRMNNCLADLSRLVPTNYLKKGRGRIEKTEIIEMAIKHLKHLQAHPCSDPATCEVAKTTEQDHKRQYRLGFHECLSETVRFLVEIEGLYAGDGLCVRLVNHLQKHYDKVAGGMCYTQALGLMSSDETKMLPMDVDSINRETQLETFSETAPPLSDTIHNDHSMDSRSAGNYTNSEILKQENELNNNPAHTNFHEVIDYAPSSGAPIKVSSQLREMLQAPGLPKEQTRTIIATVSSAPQPTVLTTVSMNGTVTSPSHGQPTSSTVSRNEEVYKFKNNIKHRFNNDLRHHASSPTDSHSDHISLPDDERTQNEPRSQQLHIAAVDESLGPPPLCHNGHTNGHTNGHHRPYSPFQPVSELSVKIPERTIGNTTPHHPGPWDCHGETASSSSSNPSTPPVGRSNGSSSGYSTNGDVPHGSKLKPLHSGHHSPVVSPYSRTPDHVLPRSPSPPHGPPSPGVPIFALHPKGTFYIPLTIDASFLAPYIMGLDDLAPVLHPVSICVNFSLCHAPKVEKIEGQSFQLRSQAYFIDRYNEQRYVYGERHHF